METITITKEDFNKAIAKALERTTTRIKEMDNSNPMAACAIPMLGVLFSKDIEEFLFGDKDPNQEG
jgi:hypothetical protein